MLLKKKNSSIKLLFNIIILIILNIINIKNAIKKIISYYKLFLSIIYNINLFKNRFFDF